MNWREFWNPEDGQERGVGAFRSRTGRISHFELARTEVHVPATTYWESAKGL
jgi:hypothetical protein